MTIPDDIAKVAREAHINAETHEGAIAECVMAERERIVNYVALLKTVLAEHTEDKGQAEWVCAVLDHVGHFIRDDREP